MSDEQLRAVGLSGAKTQYGRTLATDIVEGRIDFEALHALDDAAAVAMLTQAKGIGPWTAEIYLMFAHGRPDIMPGLDLGLVVAAQHLKRCASGPTPSGCSRSPKRGGRGAVPLRCCCGTIAATCPTGARKNRKRRGNDQRSTARATGRRPAASPAISWCCCTATAPTATT